MIWLLLTLITFLVARFINRKLNHPLANPLLISIAIIIPFLILMNIPYQDYFQGNKWLTYLLQPAVVALAYPLYEQLPEIKSNWKVIFLACGVGSALSMVTATLIAIALDTDITLIASILGKSVTTPIAMEVSRQLGGEPAIAAIMVLLVGVFGAILAYPIYNLLGITHPIAKGLTMGTVSHALGTATCVEKNPKDAAFSSLALVLCGVITSILAPAIFAMVVWLYY